VFPPYFSSIDFLQNFCYNICIKDKKGIDNMLAFCIELTMFSPYDSTEVDEQGVIAVMATEEEALDYIHRHPEYHNVNAYFTYSTFVIGEERNNCFGTTLVPCPERDELEVY
jgi:hypothetical protein